MSARPWSMWAKAWTVLAAVMLLTAIFSAFAGDWSAVAHQLGNAVVDIYIVTLILDRDRMEAALQHIAGMVRR